MTFDSFFETFRDIGYVAFLTFATSVIAIVVSLISLHSSRRSNRRLIEIEERRDRQNDQASKTALLRAHIVKEGRPDRRSADYHLEIENLGTGIARDVQLFLDGIDAGDHPSFHGSGAIAVLGSKSTKKCMLMPTMSNPNPKLVKIAWTDDTGETRDYESTL